MSLSLANLAKKHRPYIYMHTKEKFFMISLTSWFSVSTVVTDGMTSYRKPNPDFDVKNVKFNETPEITCFARPAPTADGCKSDSCKGCVGEEGDIDLVYTLFFAFNGPKRVAGVAPVDAHVADAETFIVRLDKEMNVKRYLLSKHGDFSIHKKLDEKDGRPVVYCAVNSHALYSTPGSHIRLFGMGNDSTNHGPLVDPKVFFLENSSALLNYPVTGLGNLGPKGVGSLKAFRNKAFYKQVSFTTIPNLVANLCFYAIWALVPLVLIYAFDGSKKKSKLNFLIMYSVLLYFSSFVLKLIITFVGPMFDLDIARDSALGWIFPLCCT